MIVIGLTGGSGAGKGYAGAIFAEFGVPCLDTDTVSRIVCEPGKPCLDELRGGFGDEIIRKDGTLDRTKLALLAFSDDSKLEKLNRITHRFILEYCRKWLERLRSGGCRAAVIDAPLLYESGFDLECDVTVAVIAERGERIRRIMKRDKITAETARRRLSKQKNDDFYIAKSDFVIYNNTDGEDLHSQIEAVMKAILPDETTGTEKI